MSISSSAAFQLAYQISPIILYQGIAQFMPGGYLPLAAITEGVNLLGDVLSQSNLSTYQPFASFEPLPGSTLLDFDIATYPFANLQMAANAVVQKPLQISMLMKCPAQNNGGYYLKLAALTALQTAIQNHVTQGGSFIVATPAYIYNNCLLLGLRDVTSPSDIVKQYIYQWDFVQPLLTQSAASSVLNSFMNKANQALPVQPTWSGTGVTIGGITL
jgi:hypothetical protein